MRQFDVYPNPSLEARDVAPYLVVLSSHHLRQVPGAIVAPAVNDAAHSVGGLEIAIEVRGVTLSLVVSELFNIDDRRLRGVVANLAEHEDDIRRALDRLFSGF